MILPSPLPKPPKVAKPIAQGATPPSTPRKRALDIDGVPDGAPPAKRAKPTKAPEVNLSSPSKKRRLEEDGLLILDNPDEKIDEGDGPELITIEDD